MADGHVLFALMNQIVNGLLPRLASAAGKHLTRLFEGWVVATPDRRTFAVPIKSYPAVDISKPFDWNATAADVTEQMRAAIDD